MINPLYMNDIEEMETEVSEENRERFKIHDLSSLTWAMRKLSAIEAKKADVNLLVNNEKERLEQYRTKELENLQGSENFFHSLIHDYAERMRAEDPKFKQSTPYGKISYRKQTAKWNYDDSALIEYLEQNEFADLIRIKKEPVKTEIKKLFKVDKGGYVYDTNGQEVHGILVEHLPDQLTVKVGE
jgi:phage host-nuclease inhibitor protein Gam